MNSGAIMIDGKYYLVARIEGNDRKSFFGVAESDNGIDGFKFWDYPILLDDVCPNETNVYDMRLTQHEDGYIYGVFCSESKDTSVNDLSAAVAEAGIASGADLINDIWGLKYDPNMAAVIAKYDVVCCLMHNKSNTEYQNFLIDMLAETQECVNLARQAGIKDEKIMLDPGIGFGKTFEMNLEAMNHLELFQNLGFPVLLGTSRKSMIGLALDLPVDQRVEGTLATSVIGVMKGCSFVRVHDIKENKRVIQMTEAILGCR